ncbi:MAG: hypothetical protein ACHREM_34035 [Polyangiales bacterium]
MRRLDGASALDRVKNAVNAGWLRDCEGRRANQEDPMKLMMSLFASVTVMLAACTQGVDPDYVVAGDTVPGAAAGHDVQVQSVVTGEGETCRVDTASLRERLASMPAEGFLTPVSSGVHGVSTDMRVFKLWCARVKGGCDCRMTAECQVTIAVPN